MHSAKSANSPVSFGVEFSNDKKDQNNQRDLDNQQQPIQIHNNDILFLKEINNLNRSKGGNIRTVLSSLRPSFQAMSNNDYFLCHICHLYPKIVTTWKEGTNEYPFARNIGAITRHLLYNHYKLEGVRHLTTKVEAFLSSIEEDIEAGKEKPPFFQPVSIPKSSSTSCLRAAWKSNQTKLTKEMVNTYKFDQDNCVGHVKIIPTEGMEYEHDLANSVYCSCKTRTINYDDSVNNPGPMLILDQDLSLGSTPSFFNQNKKSIIHSHRTLKCPYRIHMEQPRRIHHHSYQLEKPKTRSMTSKENQHDQQNKPSTHHQPAHPAPGSSGRQNHEGRQDPEGSSHRTPHQYQKGVIRTPRNGYRKLAVAAVDLLKPVSKKKAVRLSELTF